MAGASKGEALYPPTADDEKKAHVADYVVLGSKIMDINESGEARLRKCLEAKGQRVIKRIDRAPHVRGSRSSRGAEI